MKKLFGLLSGNKQGPWIHTEGLQEGRAIVRGLDDEGIVTLEIEADGECYTRIFCMNGVHFFEPGIRARFSYEGKSKTLQCLIVAA